MKDEIKREILRILDDNGSGCKDNELTTELLRRKKYTGGHYIDTEIFNQILEEMETNYLIETVVYVHPSKKIWKRKRFVIKVYKGARIGEPTERSIKTNEA